MTGENLAWKSHVEALAADWFDGEIDERTMVEQVYAAMTPANVRGVLDAIGHQAAGKFEWWFTSSQGDRIPEKTFVIFGGTYVGEGPMGRHKRTQRLNEAIHRAILDRREPH